MRRGAWVLLGAGVGLSACSTIFGDVVFVGTAATAGTGGVTATGGGAPSTGGETTASHVASGVTSGSGAATTGTGGEASGCDAGATVCGTTCTALQSDRHNCGTCGHDCMQGTCSAGLCQPWSVAKNQTVTAMDSDGTYVVWADAVNGVHQVPAIGGTIIKVTQSVTGSGCGPVLRSGTVAFCGTDRAYGVPEGQAGMTAFSYFTPYSPGVLSLGPTGINVYLLGIGGSSYYLVACPLVSGGFCQPVNNGTQVDSAKSGQSLVGSFFVNASYAFWLYFGAAPAVTRYTFGSNAVDTVGFTQAAASILAIDGSNVYWVATPTSTIYALPQSFTTTSGMTPTKVASNPGQIGGLAADDVNVYFGTYEPTGSASLSYVPVGGGTATTMYTSPNVTAGGEEDFVVAAAGAVYWVDLNFGASPATANIMGIAAP